MISKKAAEDRMLMGLAIASTTILSGKNCIPSNFTALD